MVGKENVVGTKVSVVDVDKEAQRIVSEFLIPTFDGLKTSFKSVNDFQITVFIRSGCYKTNPITSVYPIPKCPMDNHSEFWLKVVECAKASGMESDSFPCKVPPYLFSFTMHYSNK